jgi:hypothetical protein
MVLVAIYLWRIPCPVPCTRGVGVGPGNQWIDTDVLQSPNSYSCLALSLKRDQIGAAIKPN